MDVGDFLDIIVEKYPHIFQKELDEINKGREESEKLDLKEAMINHEICDIQYTLEEAKVDIPLYMIDSEADMAFLGHNPAYMEMDETKRQFLERVECEINTFLGKNTKCSYISHDYCC